VKTAENSKTGNALSDAPPLAYFVHNTYLSTPVYSGICGLSAKGGNYDGSRNLRMICNMGGDDNGVTQFNSCEVNVF